jgi:hypothetical protein
MCGVGTRYVKSPRVQGLGSPWLESKSQCRGGGGGRSVGGHESGGHKCSRPRVIRGACFQRWRCCHCHLPVVILTIVLLVPEFVGREV